VAATTPMMIISRSITTSVKNATTKAETNMTMYVMRNNHP